MSERSTITRHALTVLAGQLAVMAFGVADTIVAGRHSADSLAALSVASAIFISVYVALMGVLQAMLPVWAEQRGAGQHAAMGASLRQALYLCAVATMIGMAALLSPGPILHWTQVPPDLQVEVETYLAVLALALPPALLFRVYSTLNQAIGHPQLVTWLQVASLFVKVPLSVWFTFGGAGLAGQGVVGCAWATLVVNYTMLGLSVWLLRTQAIYKPLAIWKRPEPPHRPTLVRLLKLGLPAGLAVMVEVTSFTLMALFVARQGTTASAAHQIAANVAAILYMVPLSLAIATSARVSFWLGAGQPSAARRAVLTGFRLNVLVSAGLSAIIFIANDRIGEIYSTSASVVAMTGGVIAWVALYHAFDALQTLSVFVLRCYGVTVAPLLVYCVMLWGAGLGGGYLLAYEGPALWSRHFATSATSPTPFWAASAAALGITAMLFLWILKRSLEQQKTTAALA